MPATYRYLKDATDQWWRYSPDTDGGLLGVAVSAPTDPGTAWIDTDGAGHWFKYTADTDGTIIPIPVDAPPFPALYRLAHFNVDEIAFEDNVVRSPKESGTVVTRPRWSKTRRTWKISDAHMPTADYTALETFYRTTLAGGAGAFLFTFPAAYPWGTVEVRFAKPYSCSRGGFRSYPDTSKNGQAWVFSAEIEEV